MNKSVNISDQAVAEVAVVVEALVKVKLSVKLAVTKARTKMVSLAKFSLRHRIANVRLFSRDITNRYLLVTRITLATCTT